MLTPERRAELREYVEGKIAWNAPDRPDSIFPEINAEDYLALLDAADERDELDGVESRLSALLWDLTGGKLSKTSYPVAFMVQEIEEYLAQYQESEAADERDRLAAAIERVQKLAEGWHSRGEHLMAYSKTVPDEVADALLEAGAESVERARLLRNALDGSDG